MANADLDELCEAVRPCGLHRTKGENLRDAARLLLDRFGGVLPDTMEELLLFPGVGRKIANLLLGDVFGKPAIVTDTHFIRICGRLGAYAESEKSPEKIERLMTPLIPPEESSDLCHRIVQFGRDVCTARAPKCEGCPLRAVCAHSAQ
jgi:endonuclease-3